MDGFGSAGSSRVFAFYDLMLLEEQYGLADGSKAVRHAQCLTDCFMGWKGEELADPRVAAKDLIGQYSTTGGFDLCEALSFI